MKALAAEVPGAAAGPGVVLEVAAGTGAVTRELARRLPPTTEPVATDLNTAMLEEAAAIDTARPVTWRTADAMQLPFPDASFDAVVCQFGAMFFPSRPGAYAEARRVLRPGGTLLFNVWDRLETNALAQVVTDAMAALFPADPPRFLARTPHGYHDRALIAADLAEAGFGAPALLETLTLPSVADAPATAASAYCQGTPLRNELEARAAVATLAQSTALATEAIGQRYGSGRVEAPMQAHVVVVRH